MTRLLFAIVLLAAALPGARFYPDDPLATEPAPRDASKAVRRKISDYYDFFQQMFVPPGEQNVPPKGKAPGKQIPAGAVNSLGEPMESAWWRPGHYYKRMSVDELVRGPGGDQAPATDGPWTVVKAKSEGVTPGFEFIDSRKRRYVLKFDPLEYPEIATAPDALVARFFHALGYYVPDNYIVHFTREQLVLGADVEILDSRGKPRKMTDRDITELLVRVPKDSDGRYRGGASKYLSGKPIGPYKYYGLRKDDPNDIVPHEHRRDLRGLSVFCAWLAHDDSRSINSLDMLITPPSGAPFIRHHLIDFGSTLGSASYGPNSPRSGFEYLFSWPPAIKQFLTLGLWVPEWAKAKYPGIKAVGRFESGKFDAAGWVAEYPNPAFTNRLPDDAFWGAKQVMAFTNEEIRAIVKTGEYSDPKAEDWIVRSLIVRRDKIGRAFFAQVLPLDRFRIEGGQLRFDDLEVQHGFAKPRTYDIRWSGFDNAAGSRNAGLSGEGPGVPALGPGSYAVADVTSSGGTKKVTAYVRNASGKVEVVGIERTW